MSQIIKPLTSAGPIPPIIAITYTADDATTATPAANNLNLFSEDVSTNNLNGVQSTAAGSTLTYQLTNRITGTATTTDGATPVNVFTFNLGATPGNYLFRSYLTVFNDTDKLGASYSSFASVRTTGALGTLLNSGNYFISEETGMETLDLANEVTANTLALNVTGLADKTIRYVALTEYIFVS